MAHLGAVLINGGTINTPQAIYTTPTVMDSTLNVRAVNVGAGDAAIKMWITAANVSPPSNLDLVESIAAFGDGSVLENTAFALTDGNTIWVQSDIADVSFVAFGHEDPLLP